MTAHVLPAVPAGVDWRPFGSGESGDQVYRRSDNVAFAKVCDAINMGRLDGERRRMEWLARYGVASPRVLDWSSSPDGACLVTSALPGVPSSTLRPPELRGAWPALVRLIRTLHAVPVADCPFERRLPEMLARAEEIVSRDAVRSEFLSPERRHVSANELLNELRAEVPRRLEQELHDLVVCHGDACLPNFIVDPNTLLCLGVVDLGRLGAADRYADLSLLIGNARPRWRDDDEADQARRELFDLYGTPPDDQRLRFYLHLDPLTW